LLDNLERDKKISENNNNKYLKKFKNQQLYRKDANLFEKNSKKK